ncbi:hypothetical protein [Streptomyces sp. NPDC005017]
MNRERQLAQAFVALSDTYAAEFDPLQLFAYSSTPAWTCWTPTHQP